MTSRGLPPAAFHTLKRNLENGPAHPGRTRDLAVLLANPQPILRDGEFRFCSSRMARKFTSAYASRLFVEEEGTTLVFPLDNAHANGIKRLAAAGMSVNAISACHPAPVNPGLSDSFPAVPRKCSRLTRAGDQSAAACTLRQVWQRQCSIGVFEFLDDTRRLSSPMCKYARQWFSTAHRYRIALSDRTGVVILSSRWIVC